MNGKVQVFVFSIVSINCREKLWYFLYNRFPLVIIIIIYLFWRLNVLFCSNL